MRHDFLDRVAEHGMIDTTKYRYIACKNHASDGAYVTIKRIQKSMLEAAAVLSDQSADNPNGWRIMRSTKC